MIRTNLSNEDQNTATAKAEVVLLGQDVHASQITVVVQVDGSMPRHARQIRVEEYLAWIKKLRAQYPKARFYSCYEAGPCGYWLHRELSELGVINTVVAPVSLSGRRKTDKRDARHLTAQLDMFVRGNREALSLNIS